jgi:hypothetical protein
MDNGPHLRGNRAAILEFKWPPTTSIDEAMDDYRDLITAAFGLACAGAVLVVGQLYLERGARHGDVQQIQLSVRKPSPPPVVSSGKDPKSNAPG